MEANVLLPIGPSLDKLEDWVAYFYKLKAKSLDLSHYYCD